MYFAPDYFPKLYFAYYYASIGVQPGPLRASCAMSRAISSILSKLERMGCFAEVRLGSDPNDGPLRAEGYPLAMLVPESWHETDDSQIGFRVRSVLFQLVLVAREMDAEAAFRLLDGLSSRVQGALEGSTLDGNCHASRTRLRAGQYNGREAFPEQRFVLRGE